MPRPARYPSRTNDRFIGRPGVGAGTISWNGLHTGQLCTFIKYCISNGCIRTVQAKTRGKVYGDGFES